MKLNELRANPGATKKRTRVGRGHSSGLGKTSGSGTKGQKSRSGVAINGFEGGQMPLYRRLPKQGFTNIHAKEFGTVSIGKIQAAIDSGKLENKGAIDETMLVKSGLVRRKKDGVRVLSNGELKAKISLKVSGVSAKAKEMIEKAGGSVDVIVRDVKPVVRKKPKSNA